MPKFRKKPIVIEAIRYDGFILSRKDIFKLSDKGIKWFPEDNTLLIRTLEGVMTANVGDWIIKGVAGEVYPCKPDIFEATFEMVDESEY